MLSTLSTHGPSVRPSNAQDASSRFWELRNRATHGQLNVPRSYATTSVMFVGGLLSERLPSYFRPNMEAVASLGLASRRVAIDSHLSTAENAHTIRRAVRREIDAGRTPLLFGHSFGNRDIEYALQDGDTRASCIGWIAAQAGFSGMRLAAITSRSRLLSGLFHVGMSVMGGNMRALRENTPEYRSQHGLREAPAGLTVTTLGSIQDEFVSPDSCQLRGALSVTVSGFRHNETVTSAAAQALTQALVVMTLDASGRRNVSPVRDYH
jgi:hypothetical protein